MEQFEEPFAGYHQYQYAAGLKPSITVLEEHRFGATGAVICKLVVVGRVEVNQRERLDRCMGIEDAALNDLVQRCPGIGGPEAVEFDPIATALSILGDEVQRAAGARARIQRGVLRRESQTTADSLRFCFRKGIVTELETGCISGHRYTSSREAVVVVVI